MKLVHGMLLSEFITFPERVSVYFTMTMSVKRPIKGQYFQYLLYIYIYIYIYIYMSLYIKIFNIYALESKQQQQQQL